MPPWVLVSQMDPGTCVADGSMYDLFSEIKTLKSSVPSKIIRIKLNEVSNLLLTLGKKHLIEDKDVLTMLRYYELVNELKNAGSK